MSGEKIGDRVRVVLEGELIAYDADKGHWTMRGHAVPGSHVEWVYTLHWASPFQLASDDLYLVGNRPAPSVAVLPDPQPSP